MSTISLWVVLGTCLLVAEMVSGTFFLLFLSLGAFSASLAGILGLTSFPLQIVVCGLVSALGFLLLKKPLQKKMLKSAAIQLDLGKTIIVDTALSPGQTTRISYQGSTWDARNEGAQSLIPGETALIVGTDSHLLLIKKQD